MRAGCSLHPLERNPYPNRRIRLAGRAPKDASVTLRGWVRTRLGAIKACYERALKRNPTLSGKVVIHWTITQAGTVSGVDVESDTLGDAEVASCINRSFVVLWRTACISAFGSLRLAW